MTRSDEEERVPTPSIFSLYKFASPWDTLLLVVGTLAGQNYFICITC
jgi:hypothetical protein